MPIERCSYHLINRAGDIILSGCKNIASVGEAGLALVNEKDFSYSLFSALRQKSRG